MGSRQLECASTNPGSAWICESAQIEEEVDVSVISAVMKSVNQSINQSINQSVIQFWFLAREQAVARNWLEELLDDRI